MELGAGCHTGTAWPASPGLLFTQATRAAHVRTAATPRRARRMTSVVLTASPFDAPRLFPALSSLHQRQETACRCSNQ